MIHLRAISLPSVLGLCALMAAWSVPVPAQAATIDCSPGNLDCSPCGVGTNGTCVDNRRCDFGELSGPNDVNASDRTGIKLCRFGSSSHTTTITVSVNGSTGSFSVSANDMDGCESRHLDDIGISPYSGTQTVDFSIAGGPATLLMSRTTDGSNYEIDLVDVCGMLDDFSDPCDDSMDLPQSDPTSTSGGLNPLDPGDIQCH